MSRTLVLAAVALAMGSGPALAQDAPNQPKKEKPPVATSITNVGLKGRNGAPMMLDVTIKYVGEKVYRGPVRLIVRRGGGVYAQIDAPEIVVVEGETRHRYVLPAVSLQHDQDTSTTVTVQMLSDQGTLNLGTRTFGAPAPNERVMVMGLVDSWSRPSGAAAQMRSTLNFQRFKPSGQERGLAATPARIDPNAMPRQPIALCAFDVLVISPDALAELEEDQLDAIRAWVRAGGSAAVALGADLTFRHADFLNETIAGDGGGHRYIAQPNGAVVIDGDAPSSNVGVYDAGFGRLIVAIDASDEALFESPAWTHAAIHLWRFRASQGGPIRAGRGWDVKQEQPTQRVDQWGNELDEIAMTEGFRYYPLQLPNGGKLEPLLMPTTVRVVPFALVVGILVLFALAVGPGDWFLLGMIRQHKLTWVLFPAVAVAFTVLTVFVAEYYMGSRSYERSLVFEDVDASGTVLKRSRLQLTFSATQKRVTHDLSGVLLKPMSPDSYVMNMQYDYAMPQGVNGASAEAARQTQELAGRFPQAYRAAQRVQKWSPRVDRFTQIAPTEGDAPTHIRWGRITTELLEAGRAGEILPESFEGTLMVYHRGRDPKIVVGNTSPAMIGYQTNGGDNGALVTDICARPREGMFTIVSQLSPTGSDNLEDLSVFDQDDATQWLIVVLEARGDDLMVYRYLHREPGDRR